MVVYVEYVIAENFLIDFFLLKTAFYLSGVKSGKLTLIIAAVLGGAFALFLSFFELSQISSAIVKIAFGVSMVLLAGKFSILKEFYVSVVFFFALSFAVGGAITGVYSVFGVNAERFTAFTVIPVCALCYLTKKLFAFLKIRARELKHTFKIEITVGGVTVKGRGFCDTGNGVYISDSPVAVCSEKFFRTFFKSGFKMPAVRKIAFSTVSGKDVMRTVKTDKLLIYIADEPNIFYNVALGIVKASVGVGYDVILPPALLESENENRSDIKIKKVS